MLIGLTGLAGCGKSTAAQYLAHEHNWTRLRMADPLKNMMRTLFTDMGYDPPTVERMIEGDLKEVRNPDLTVTPRHAMQTLGTEWGREMIHPNFWVTVAYRRILAAKGRVVVEDIRFDNEAMMIRRLGGQIIRIVRHDHTGIEGSHESENGLSSGVIDTTIRVNGGVDQLQRLIAKVVLPTQP